MLAAVTRTVQEFLNDQPLDMAGALSYYTLLSIAPLLLVVLATAGMFLDGDVVRAEIFNQIRSLLGIEGANLIDTIITKADRPTHGVIAMISGLVITVLGATTVFAQLQGALNRIWHVQAAPDSNVVWGFIRHRVLSLGLVLTIALLLLMSLVISAVLAGMEGRLNAYVPGAAILWRILNVVVSLGLITVLIAMIFKFLPDAKIEWRDTWLGAFITSLLFTVGKFLIGLYLGQASVGSTYGAAGSVVVLMVWIYYASLILFFGAKITEVIARSRGAHIQPSAHAQPSD
ncbi:MAG: YihY/virulence factor BrkB family protein [Gammaproteobacteria bacterium]|nr:YihY/virulence factor BrkB family protein [Gammaproteobacteria bacterium]